MGGCLFAQIMSAPRGKTSLIGVFEFCCDLRRFSPFTGALEGAQQRQPSLPLKMGAFQAVQGGLCAIQQASLEEVERQGVLCAIPVCSAQVSAREQVFVNPHCAFVFPAPAKEVAQRKVQFGGVRIVLYSFYEGVNGLILLLIEKKVEALEISFGRAPVFDAHLAHIQARGQPTQAKRERQT